MSESGRVPQAAPGLAIGSQRAAIYAAVRDVLDSGRYILGPQVAAFESEFAAFIGTEHAVGVASGTDALELALRAVGLGEGDHVFTVSLTATATAAAIQRSGATAIFVDIDPATYTMDPGSLQEAIDRTRASRDGRGAVLPVHLYGQPADMPRITTIAEAAGLPVIEDCAQAHGASLDGRMAGTGGVAAAFSFYPTKNLGGAGDGGMVVTSSAEVAARVRAMREYGWRERFVSHSPGFNSRLDELQAAILRVRLLMLVEENDRRADIASIYGASLAGSDIVPPRVAPGARHVYHQYVVRTPARARLREHLAQDGIDTAVHYPVPVHEQPTYRPWAPSTDGLRTTEQASGEILSLPIHPALTDTQVERVAASLRAFSESSG